MREFKEGGFVPLAFFWSAERRAALVRELESWRGTPFLPSAGETAKKGASCDCVSFVAGVLANLGAIDSVPWPAYVVRGGGRAMLDLLRATIARLPLAELPPHLLVDALPGDVFVCSSGRALHHLAIYGGHNTVWHALDEVKGVCTGNLHDPMLQRHLIAIYRPMES